MKNVPPQLAAIEGLISTDLKEYKLEYDHKEQCFSCGDCCTEKPMMAAVAASSAAKAAEELLQEESFDFEILPPAVPGAGDAPNSVSVSGSGGASAGFPRHY